MVFRQFRVRRREQYILKMHALAMSLSPSGVQAALLVHWNRYRASTGVVHSLKRSNAVWRVIVDMVTGECDSLSTGLLL
jgi:hypothetical protein